MKEFFFFFLPLRGGPRPNPPTVRGGPWVQYTNFRERFRVELFCEKWQRENNSLQLWFCVFWYGWSAWWKIRGGLWAQKKLGRGPCGSGAGFPYICGDPSRISWSWETETDSWAGIISAKQKEHVHTKYWTLLLLRTGFEEVAIRIMSCEAK